MKRLEREKGVRSHSARAYHGIFASLCMASYPFCLLSLSAFSLNMPEIVSKLRNVGVTKEHNEMETGDLGYPI